MSEQIVNRASLSVAYAAGKGDGRYYLSTIQIKGGTTAATNGHIAARVTTPGTKESEAVYLPAESAKAVKVDASIEGLQLVYDDSKTGKTAIELTPDNYFPDIAAVVPKGAPQFAVGLSNFVLEKAVKVVKEFYGKLTQSKLPGMVFTYYGTDQPLQITATNVHHQTLDMLIMPCHTDLPETEPEKAFVDSVRELSKLGDLKTIKEGLIEALAELEQRKKSYL